jgi:hypothetical protein
MRIVRAVLLLLLITSLAKADGGLPLDVLKSLKSATVFVKVEFGKLSTSGSGFVLKKDKDTAWIVTNHHVVRPTVQMKQGTGKDAKTVPTKILNANVSVILGSGTRKEQVARAVVVSDDPQRDLALLKVSGLKDLPAPLNIEKPPEVNETMSIYVLGFPYGKALSTGKGNPAITVSKGSISSLRLNDAGDLAFLQIDGGLNPGNSGGPVVTEKGQLVGIAVARVKDSNIGLVIPSQALHQGRVVHIHFNILQRDKEAIKIQLEMRLFDPLSRLRGVTFHYTPAAAVKGKDRVSALPEAKQVKMEIKDQAAVGRIDLHAGKALTAPITFQTEQTQSDGKSIFSPVHSGTLKIEPKTAIAGPNLPPKGKPLTKEERAAALADLKEESSIKRRRACDRLAAAEPDMDHKDVIDALKPLLDDSNPVTRLAAVKAHITWAGKDGLDRYYKMLKTDSDAAVRAAVIEGLSRLAGAAAAESIAARLPEADDRIVAARALVSIGPPAEKVVVGYLDHREWGVRVETCKILKAIGTIQSLPALQKASEGLLGVPKRHVDRASAEAIEAISGRK